MIRMFAAISLLPLYIQQKNPFSLKLFCFRFSVSPVAPLCFLQTLDFKDAIRLFTLPNACICTKRLYAYCHLTFTSWIPCIDWNLWKYIQKIKHCLENKKKNKKYQSKIPKRNLKRPPKRNPTNGTKNPKSIRPTRPTKQTQQSILFKDIMRKSRGQLENI